MAARSDAGEKESEDGALERDRGAALAACYLDQDGDGVGSGSPVPCPESEPDAGIDFTDGGTTGHALPRGFASVVGDCDDLSTARSPDFMETCDEVDNDCDGIVNEGYDVGAPCDGVGACGAGTVECASLTTTRCSTDPGGSEDGSADDESACDGEDEDCDGEIDENWNVGKACDGVGACGLGVFECASASASRCSTDPGGSTSEAVAEVCDGQDNDCNGVVDDGLKVLSYWADCDKDDFGAGVSFTGCKAPTSGSCPFVTNKDDCVDTNANINPGQTGWYTTPVKGSFDYDCTGTTEKLYTRTCSGITDTGSLLVCFVGGYWQDRVVPACGETAAYCERDDCSPRTQACH